MLSQNLPVPPIGLFTSVVAKFTYIIRVIYECYTRIYLYHQYGYSGTSSRNLTILSGLSTNAIAEFTCTTNRVIHECRREIYLYYQGYLRMLSQNLPVPPIGLFTSVVAKFTYIIRVIYECYRRIYLYHQ